MTIHSNKFGNPKTVEKQTYLKAECECYHFINGLQLLKGVDLFYLKETLVMEL